MLNLSVSNCKRSEPQAYPLSCVQSLPSLCTKHLLLLFFAILLINAHLRTHSVLCARGKTQQEKLERQKEKKIRHPSNANRHVFFTFYGSLERWYTLMIS